MTAREDFTDEEWASVSALPGAVIGAVAIADGKNLIKLTKEAAAGGSTLTTEVAKYPDNILVQAMAGGGSSQAPKDVKSTEDAANAQVDIVEATFALLRAKATPAEVMEVGTLLLTVANAVANAAGSGFFGGGDDKVDPREQAVIDRLTAIVSG